MPTAPWSTSPASASPASAAASATPTAPTSTPSASRADAPSGWWRWPTGAGSATAGASTWCSPTPRPRGVGDGDDEPHRGFAALHELVARLEPPLLLHGHVPPVGGAGRDRALGPTVVRNVVGRYVFVVVPKWWARSAGRHAS